MYYSGLHQYQLPAAPHSGAPSLMIPGHSQQHGEPHHYRHQQPRGTTSLVGQPIHFTEGQFKGKTIRAELCELQAAAFGRKYAKVDRRPLDPPPVAWLRLFEVHHAGTEAQRETEVDYDNMHILGLMCTVELIPVAAPDAPSPGGASYAHANSPYSPPPDSPYASLSPASVAYSPPGSPSAVPGDGTLHKATTALAGTTFVQVDSIPWQGRTCLLFTFADLAVKIEGYFILQYRFFDLFSRPAGNLEYQPIQADCTGSYFRIYSSKEVPPLGKSTELTKHLARYGVRVNVRETERKRKKKERLPSASPPYTTRHMPDKSPPVGSDDDDEDD
ncbi:velvet factor-domain-containing protein [Mycena latifolia]|nr:velvet factor-domain-containing protein [Mycena latifolia]